MATRKTKAPSKKAATKKAPRGRRPAASANLPADVPAGFTRVEGFSERWDYEAQPELRGIWGSIQTVTVPTGRGKQEDRRYVDVTTDDGRVLTVWESAALTRSFDTVPEGSEAFIRFRGHGEAKKGQNAPKLFDVYYKQF